MGIRRGSPVRFAVLISLPALLVLSPVSAPASTEDLAFHISPSVSPAVGAEIQRIFQQSLDFLGADLGVTLSRPVTIFVYGSQREIFEGLIDELAYSEAEARAIAAQAAYFVIGQRMFVNAGTSLFLDAPRRVDRTRMVAHELAHITHNDLMGGGAVAPKWIREGFAVRMELRAADHFGFHASAEDAQGYVNLTRFALRQKELIPLTDLASARRWEDHIQREGSERVYAQSFAAVDYLMRTRGQPQMLAYFRAFRSSSDAAANFVGAFGVAVEAFDQEFQSYLGSQAR